MQEDLLYGNKMCKKLNQIWSYLCKKLYLDLVLYKLFIYKLRFKRRTFQTICFGVGSLLSLFGTLCYYYYKARYILCVTLGPCVNDQRTPISPLDHWYSKKTIDTLLTLKWVLKTRKAGCKEPALLGIVPLPTL